MRNHCAMHATNVREKLAASAARLAEKRAKELQQKRVAAAWAEGRQVQAENAAEERKKELERNAREAGRERKRLRLEAERLEKERLAAAAKSAKKAEAATLTYLRRSGGIQGDLRMCSRCRAGPVENKACRDLEMHNDGGFNGCRNCGWFSKG